MITPVVLLRGRTHDCTDQPTRQLAHFHFEGKASTTREPRLGSIEFLPGRYPLDLTCRYC